MISGGVTSLAKVVYLLTTTTTFISISVFITLNRPMQEEDTQVIKEHKTDVCM